MVISIRDSANSGGNPLIVRLDGASWLDQQRSSMLASNCSKETREGGWFKGGG